MQGDQMSRIGIYREGIGWTFKNGRTTCLWWPGFAFMVALAGWLVIHGKWLGLLIPIVGVPVGWLKGYSIMKIEESSERHE